jgi:putative endonuclease
MKLLARNFLCKSGEIDLIMVDTDGTIVFVEVKTRTDEAFARAETAVTETKKNRAYRAARYFLTTHGIDTRPCRFDVVTVILGTTGPARITHFQNAFVP